MTKQRLQRVLEAIGAEYTIQTTAGGLFQAISPSGEILSTARKEEYARASAEAEYERRRSARGVNPGEYVLGNGLVYGPDGHTHKA